MAAGLPDLVDCARLAKDQAALQRDYDLGEFPRLRDLLAQPHGRLQARFAFAMVPTGRARATVRIEAIPQLVCQRCMQGFGCRVSAGSEIEFTASENPDSDSEREFFVMTNGQVSLRALAEEELLLALPIAPACDTPLTCGNAPIFATGEETTEAPGDERRPFSILQDLLKKT
jgi:uncharacterized metal-binding protein YceD (DUF177 family)